MVSPDLASLAEKPSPLHITLFFKCARHTVLLSVLPSTPFSEIKSLLLLALQVRNITSIADVLVPSPDHADQVELGIPKEKKDLKKGFVSLEMVEQMQIEVKGGKKKASGDKALPSENPAGAGLVDGSILAFRFKQHTDIDIHGDDGDDEAQIPVDPGWNVELPRYDDEEDSSAQKDADNDDVDLQHLVVPMPQSQEAFITDKFSYALTYETCFQGGLPQDAG